MLKILRAYSLPEQLVSAIGILYTGTNANVYRQMGRQSFLKY